MPALVLAAAYNEADPAEAPSLTERTALDEELIVGAQTLRAGT